MERSGQHCLGTKEGLRNSKEELAGYEPAHPPLEAGGRGQGGGNRGKPGPRDSIPHQTSLQTGFQFLSKDFLRFWMADIL